MADENRVLDIQKSYWGWHNSVLCL